MQSRTTVRSTSTWLSQRKSAAADALAQFNNLRDHSYRVDYPLSGEKVGKQFQTAEQLRARVAVLFGDEWPQVKLKDMSSGEQQLVSKDDLMSHVESILR